MSPRLLERDYGSLQLFRNIPRPAVPGSPGKLRQDATFPPGRAFSVYSAPTKDPVGNSGPQAGRTG